MARKNSIGCLLIPKSTGWDALVIVTTVTVVQENGSPKLVVELILYVPGWKPCGINTKCEFGRSIKEVLTKGTGGGPDAEEIVTSSKPKSTATVSVEVSFRITVELVVVGVKANWKALQVVDGKNWLLARIEPSEASTVAVKLMALDEADPSCMRYRFRRLLCPTTLVKGWLKNPPGALLPPLKAIH